MPPLNIGFKRMDGWIFISPSHAWYWRYICGVESIILLGWYMTTSENFMTLCKMLVLCEASVLVSKLWYTCRRRDVPGVGEVLWSLVVRCSCEL